MVQNKRQRIIVMVLSLAIITSIFVGCDPHCWDCDNDCCEGDCYYPPQPTGIRSITFDGRVELSWNPIYYEDIDYYRVYRSDSEYGRYYLIAETYSAYYNDYDVANGNTYFYAVSSVNWCNWESDLSHDITFDTPRPEGYGVTLWDATLYPMDAGMDFSEYMVVAWDSYTCDVYFAYDSIAGGFYLYAGNDATDIMHYGPTSSLQDVDYAPETGWDPDGYVSLVNGHSYLIWTDDNHFAHIRVVSLYSDNIRVDWAYQTSTGNPELMLMRPKKRLETKTERDIEHQENDIEDNNDNI